MMRELKAAATATKGTRTTSCSGNPYDEGTESRILGMECPTARFVAAEIPMMRELKELIDGGMK